MKLFTLKVMSIATILFMAITLFPTSDMAMAGKADAEPKVLALYFHADW